MILSHTAGVIRGQTRRHAGVLLALSTVPGLAVASRALPPGWIHVGLVKHGSGSTQIILLFAGLYIASVGLFFCRALLPRGGAEDRSTLPAKKRITFALVTCAMLTVVAFALAEGVLRTMGQGPWHGGKYNPYVEAGGQAYLRNPTLGYTHVPGKTTFKLRDGYTFTATHLPNTLRITRPIESPKNALGLDEVWIFGCSFTHGWSVSDDETYPWLLDRMLSDRKVVNFGVTGYGTLQSLIQLKERLAGGEKPAVAVLTYASFHDERNTFQRSRRKVAGTLRQPYARLAADGNLRSSKEPIPYPEFPGMRRSALIHAIERYYNQRETGSLRSHDVSKAIIKEFADLCDKNGIQLVVAGIDRDPLTSEMLTYCGGRGISTVDISVDLTRSEYNNRPHDGHPSAAAHRKYAEKLYACLK